jgi:PAS domain S-box-containing protein
MIETKTAISDQKTYTKEPEFQRLLTTKIFQVVTDIIFVLDIKTKTITYSNYSSSEFLGYSKEKFLEIGFQFRKQILDPSDYDLVKNSINELNNSVDGNLNSFEIRLKDKNKSYQWFEIKLSVFSKDSNNNIVQIIGILKNIGEYKRMQAALIESELSYKNLFNTIEDAIYIQDEFGYFLDANKAAIDSNGYPKEEIIGKKPEFLSAPDKNDFNDINSKITSAFNGVPQQFEFYGKKKDGTFLLKDIKLYSGLYFGKKVIIAHAQDITIRKKEEEKMHGALAEKNALLREVHHRVKNNLQAMIYLIEMQIDKLDDMNVQIFLKELQEQARTMSLVYEQLYQSDYLAQVDMDEYLNNLTSNVIQAFGLGKDISFHVNANNVSLDVETAMPCGLIINEILTNSLKYAFPDVFSTIPKINVELSKDKNKITIIISDNGVGLPPNFDWENTDSLGLKLVNFWIKYQLAGSIQLDEGNGTNYTISFDYED